jgi:site-specific recombinase XerD
MARLNKEEKNTYISLSSAALAKNTWFKYKSALNQFLKFCKEKKINRKKSGLFFGITETRFILWLNKTKCLAHDTVIAYISGIKFFNKFLGFDEASASNNPSKKIILQSLGRLENPSKKCSFPPLLSPC